MINSKPPSRYSAAAGEILAIDCGLADRAAAAQLLARYRRRVLAWCWRLVQDRESALDLLEDTPENRAFAEAVRPVVQRYKDIGVRVEDS